MENTKIDVLNLVINGLPSILQELSLMGYQVVEF